MTQKFLIRKMKQDEVQLALDWARKEGWNPGLNDAACFYEADHHGFFIGLLNGVPIATGSAVAYDEQFAFCGLYIVRPEFRQQGYGMQLTEERLKYVGSRMTGLDGVLEKVSKYQRIGYVPFYTNTRYVLSALLPFLPHQQVVELRTVSFEQVEKFDRNYFPAPRSSFLRRWIAQPNGFALGYMDQDSLLGYGVIRQCFEGYKIGPLFATQADIAQALFESLCLKAIQGPIYLDVPQPNHQALALVKYYKMVPSFEVVRMYRNGFPQMNLADVYGMTTYEIG